MHVTARQSRTRKRSIVTCDSYVTLTDGTGVVHIAPAFGEDDAKVGRKYDLPFVQLVDEKGDMARDHPVCRRVRKESGSRMVLKDLDERGLLFDAPKFEHSYPHCWRCDTPLIYYARESWFIKMTAVKDDLIAQQQHHQLDSGEHRKGPLRRLAGECPGLGHQPKPLLGNSVKYLGV